MILFLAILFSVADECIHTENSFHCVQFLSNYDGDTILVNIPNTHQLFTKISVRIRGVDTPEIRTKNKCEKKMAEIAKELVRNTLKNAKKIHLENISKGKYFRIIADVKADGVNISDLLLKSGLAYSYDGRSKKSPDWCKVKIPSSLELKKPTP